MSLVKDIQDQFRMQDNALVKIILINVLVYVLDCLIWVIAALSKSDLFYIVQSYQGAPSDYMAVLYKPWTLITYAFSHDTPSPFHIFFNMLGLYWFGGIIREYLGSRRLVSLYIIGALFGVTLYLLCYSFVPFYMEQGPSILIGASASVLAAVVGAATLIPNYRFHLMFIGPVKIVYIAAFYVLISIVGSVQGNAGGNIAHIGGAFAGFVFITFLKKGTDIGKPINALLDFVRRLFSRKNKVRMTFFNSSTPVDANYTPNQQEIDSILDKISRSGYESLTKEEKQKLFKASQKQ